MTDRETIIRELTRFLDAGGLAALHVSLAAPGPAAAADEVICHSYPVLQFVLDGLLPLRFAGLGHRVTAAAIAECEGYFSLPHAWNSRSYGTDRRMLAVNFRESGREYVITHWKAAGRRGERRIWCRVDGSLSPPAGYLLQALLGVPEAPGTEPEQAPLAASVGNSLLQALRLELAADGHSGSRTEMRWHRIAGYLDEYCHLPVQREDLGRTFGVSADHITRLFRRHAGESFPTYLNRLRVARAERLLATGNLTVQEVANQCGFRDSSYFIKVFKRFAGRTPGSG